MPKRKVTLEQTHYGNLEIDTREKDIVMIFMKTTEDLEMCQIESSEIVMIERENLPWLIEVLKAEEKKK